MPKNQEDIIINDIIQYNKFAILNIDRDNLATDVVKAVITHFFSSNGTHIPDAPHSETLVIFLIKTTTSIKHHFIAIETLQSFSKTLGEKFGKLVDVYNNLIKQKPVVVDTPLNISLSFEYIMQIFDKGVVEHYAGPFYASLLAHQIEPLSLLHSLISGNNLGEFMKNPAVMQKLMITLLNMQSPPCARLFYLYLFRKKVALPSSFKQCQDWLYSIKPNTQITQREMLQYYLRICIILGKIKDEKSPQEIVETMFEGLGNTQLEEMAQQLPEYVQAFSKIIQECKLDVSRPEMQLYGQQFLAVITEMLVNPAYYKGEKDQIKSLAKAFLRAFFEIELPFTIHPDLFEQYKSILSLNESYTLFADYGLQSTVENFWGRWIQPKLPLENLLGSEQQDEVLQKRIAFFLPSSFLILRPIEQWKELVIWLLKDQDSKKFVEVCLRHCWEQPCEIDYFDKKGCLPGKKQQFYQVVLSAVIYAAQQRWIAMTEADIVSTIIATIQALQLKDKKCDISFLYDKNNAWMLFDRRVFEIIIRNQVGFPDQIKQYTSFSFYFLLEKYLSLQQVKEKFSAKSTIKNESSIVSMLSGVWGKIQLDQSAEASYLLSVGAEAVVCHFKNLPVFLVLRSLWPPEKQRYLVRQCVVYASLKAMLRGDWETLRNIQKSLSSSWSTELSLAIIEKYVDADHDLSEDRVLAEENPENIQQRELDFAAIKDIFSISLEKFLNFLNGKGQYLVAYRLAKQVLVSNAYDDQSKQTAHTHLADFYLGLQVPFRVDTVSVERQQYYLLAVTEHITKLADGEKRKDLITKLWHILLPADRSQFILQCLKKLSWQDKALNLWKKLHDNQLATITDQDLAPLKEEKEEKEDTWLLELIVQAKLSAAYFLEKSKATSTDNQDTVESIVQEYEKAQDQDQYRPNL